MPVSEDMCLVCHDVPQDQMRFSTLQSDGACTDCGRCFTRDYLRENARRNHEQFLARTKVSEGDSE